MIKEDRYLTMRHLEAYSEIKLARLLETKRYTTFFPFKDTIGVDMVAIKKGEEEIELYQLKARNPESLRVGRGIYWFSIMGDFEKLKKLKSKSVFFVLCALQEDQKDFDFFKIPLKVAVDYFNQRRDPKTAHDFQIKREANGSFRLMPYYIRGINPNDFLINQKGIKAGSSKIEYGLIRERNARTED